MQKLGMRAEGTHRDWARKRDRFEDVVMYAILESDWQTLQSEAANERE